MKRSLCLTAVFIASITACKQHTVVANTGATAGTTANIAYNEAGTNAAVASSGTIDTAFVTDAIKADNGEIALGNLAQDKGASPALKKFGQTLVEDHTAAKQQMADLAQQGGMTVPADPKDEQKAEMQKLQGLSGDAFDKEFVRFAVEAHKKDIAAFQKEAQGTGPAADLAQKQLPTLQKHLQIAQSLQGK